MFRFAEPNMLYLLLLVPAMVAVYIAAAASARRRIARFGDPELVRALMPDASPRRNRNKFILLVCAVGLIVFALARPQTGARLRE